MIEWIEDELKGQLFFMNHKHKAESLLQTLKDLRDQKPIQATATDLSEWALREHKLWVASKGAEGVRLVIKSGNFEWKYILRGRDIQGAVFIDCSFSRCLFSGCNFSFCVFRNCGFRLSDLIDDEFISCYFQDCDFEKAMLHSSDFGFSHLERCIFTGSAIDQDVIAQLIEHARDKCDAGSLS